MWETDATARAALEQSIATSVMDVGSGALLSGVEGSVEGTARGALSSYGIDLAGSYARAMVVTIGAGATAPDDSVSANLGTYGGWDLSPRAHLALDSGGYLATRLGVRAFDPLAERDPFLYGNRLQYTVGAGPRLSVITSTRSSLDLAGRYEQTGALTADDPEAVGVDTHEASAGVRYGRDITDVDTLSPEVNYSYTHFYHALYDIDLNRGPADVHAVTGRLVESRAFNRRFSGRIGGGVTVATPPPILASQDAVVAPSALAGLIYESRRYRLTADYTYEYTSLGSRIGFGQEHSATVELAFRPMRGGRYRDVVLTGIGELAVGGAPIAANPPLATDPAEPRPSLEGTLTTFTALAGAQIEYPIARGLMLLGRFDLEYVNATFDPAPPTGQTDAALRTVWTVGLAGVISTDERNLVRQEEEEDVRGDAIGGSSRDPRAPAEDERDRGAARRPGAPAGLFGTRDDRRAPQDPALDPAAAPARKPAPRRSTPPATDSAAAPATAPGTAPAAAPASDPAAAPAPAPGTAPTPGPNTDSASDPSSTPSTTAPSTPSTAQPAERTEPVQPAPGGAGMPQGNPDPSPAQPRR